MIEHTSIAVLPFDNISSDPENEYFADGMTEEIINALSKIKGLKVTARTSSFIYKDKKVDVRLIGQELGVATILEGSIRKFQGDIRITAQLIRTDDGFHIWSENYDRKLDNIFQLQDEISLIIADKIRENFGHITIHDHLVNQPTSNIDAYQLYLKGRFFLLTWNLLDIEKAISYFIKSTQLDPTYAQPFFGVVLSYSILGSWGHMNRQEALKIAKIYLQKGIDLEQDTANRYFNEAAHQFWGYWDYKNAYQNLMKAHQLAPQDPVITDCLAEINLCLGNFKTALAYNSKGLEVNPLSANAHYVRAILFYLQGSFQQALDINQQGLMLNADFEHFQQLHLACLIQLGKKKALYTFIKQNQLHPLLAKASTQLYALFHQEPVNHNEVENTIFEIDQLKSPLLFPWDIYLKLYADQEEEALQRLKTKVDTKMGQVVNFKSDPFLIPLNKKSSWLELIKKSFPNNALPSESYQEKDKSQILNPDEVTQYMAMLISQLEDDHVYRETTLTLRSLADKINLHPNKLSWLLNDKLGKNFNDFVNSYRLLDFQTKAITPQYQHLTVLGLAYESGFTSKSVFNHFFKKSTGQTPKAWINKHKKS